MTTAYTQSASHKEESERVILAAFAYLGIPKTMLDIGCGPGAMCRVARCLNINVHGLDKDNDESYDFDDWRCSCLYRVNITDRHALSKLGRFSSELVVCTEVAEHINQGDEEAALIDALLGLTEKYLLFSAATPGQGGCGHINEQPHLYWRNKLRNAGFVENMPMTVKLRRTFSEVAPDAWWYGKNAMLFEVGQ